jgi:hypothetical protein
MAQLVSRAGSEDTLLVELSVSFGAALTEEPKETFGVRAYRAERIYADLVQLAAMLDRLINAMMPDLPLRQVVDAAAVAYVESGSVSVSVRIADELMTEACNKAREEYHETLGGRPGPMDLEVA